MESETQYCTKQDLFRRGWNAKLIERFITPTLKTINPHRKGALLNLYATQTVEGIEKSPEWLEIKRKGRTDARKTEGTVSWAKGVQINWTKDISVLALADSLDTQDGREILSALRHRHSNYEKLMQQCDDRYAPLEAKKIIRLRLLRGLTKSYSALRDGASRQWSKWYPKEEMWF